MPRRATVARAGPGSILCMGSTTPHRLGSWALPGGDTVATSPICAHGPAAHRRDRQPQKKRAVGGSGSNGSGLYIYHNPVSRDMTYHTAPLPRFLETIVPRKRRRRQSAKCTTFREISSKNGLFYRRRVLSTIPPWGISLSKQRDRDRAPGGATARAKPHAEPHD